MASHSSFVTSPGDAANLAALNIANVAVKYNNGVLALSEITCTVPTGSATALIGPNGAGKSTLLKCIVGLVKQASGSISVFGKPAGDSRSMIAYMPQRAEIDWNFPASSGDVVAMGLEAARIARKTTRRTRPIQSQDRSDNSDSVTSPNMRVQDNNRSIWSRIRARQHERKARTEWIHSCLERVGMLDLVDRRVGELSGGQQQRLFLARALAQQAKIYLMDEPFSALDPSSTELILRVFNELRQEGSTLLCAHHDMRLLETEFNWCIALDRVVIGRGEPGAVLAALRNARIVPEAARAKPDAPVESTTTPAKL